MRVRSQEHAEQVYGLVVAVPQAAQARYTALCYRFPLMVRENGLAAALGFLAAKGKQAGSAEALLLEHVAAVFGANDGELLRRSVIAARIDEYRHFTRQALSAAEWFKRYAEARFEDQQKPSERGGDAPEVNYV